MFNRFLINHIHFVILVIAALATASAPAQAAPTATAPMPPSPVVFEPPGQAVELPFVVIDNNMFIEVTVNNSKTISVAFDSGFPLSGILLLDSTMGDQLGLDFVGVTPLGGGGVVGRSQQHLTGAYLYLP